MLSMLDGCTFFDWWEKEDVGVQLINNKLIDKIKKVKWYAM